MKHFSRPYRNTIHSPHLILGLAVLSLTAAVAFMPQETAAQTSGFATLLQDPSPLLHSSSQGYMGVLVGDVDNDSAQKLKLKDVKGALVTLIDHDAPAAQAGVRVNDVILQINGQVVDSAEAFTRMLREIPAGRTISVLISRDGNTQTINVELADRKKMEHDVWNKLDSDGDSVSSLPSMGMLSGSGGSGDVSSGGFHMPFFGSALNVGAMVEPLTSQMADYLGVKAGLMIKQVARKSEAEAAGLKAFDVILKVGSDIVATTADWDRALRANKDKPVQVTILRDRRQQTVTLQVDSKRHRSELEELFSDDGCELMAALDTDAASALAAQLAGDDSAILSMQNQADALRDQLDSQYFKLDPKQMDALRQNFNPDDLKLNQQQMDELNRQMQFFQSPEFQKLLHDQMEQFKQQLEEMQVPSHPHFV